MNITNNTTVYNLLSIIIYINSHEYIQVQVQVQVQVHGMKSVLLYSTVVQSMDETKINIESYSTVY